MRKRGQFWRTRMCRMLPAVLVALLGTLVLFRGAQSAELPVLKLIGTNPAQSPAYNTLPHAVAMSRDGTLYLLNTEQGTVDIHGVPAGGGAGRVAMRANESVTSTIVLDLSDPQGLAVAPDGRIFIADTGNNRILVTDASGANVTEPISTVLSYPRDLAIDWKNNFLYVVDSENHRILKFDLQGGPAAFSAMGNNVLGGLKSPYGIGLDEEGNIFVADTYSESSMIKKYSPEGRLLLSFGEKGPSMGQLLRPEDVAVDGRGNIWVANSGNNCVSRFDAQGNFFSNYGGWGTERGQYYIPQRVLIFNDGAGELLYVVDSNLERVQVFDLEQQDTTPPELLHVPVFYAALNTPIFFEAEATDNESGITWVRLVYSVNGGNPVTKYMAHTSGAGYQAYFDGALFHIGDKITYTITAQNGAGLTVSDGPNNFSFEVIPPPSLVSPDDAIQLPTAKTDDTDFVFAWLHQNDIATYHLDFTLPDGAQLWNLVPPYASPGSLSIENSGTDMNDSFLNQLPHGVYQWKVKGLNTEFADLTEYSETRSFTNRFPAPELVSPGHGDQISQFPWLEWKPVNAAGVSGYHVTVEKLDESTGAVLSEIYNADTGQGNQLNLAGIIPPGTFGLFRWRVYAYRQGENVPGLESLRIFTLLDANAPPPAPMLVMPIGDKLENGDWFLFSWAKVETPRLLNFKITLRGPLADINNLTGAPAQIYEKTLSPDKYLVTIGTAASGMDWEILNQLPTGRYEWTVTSIDAQGVQNNTSAAAYFIKDARPKPISNLAAETNDNYIKLTWTPPTRNVDGVLFDDSVSIQIFQGFRGCMGTPGCQPLATLPITATEYTDTSAKLVTLLSYRYYIVVVDSRGSQSDLADTYPPALYAYTPHTFPDEPRYITLSTYRKDMAGGPGSLKEWNLSTIWGKVIGAESYEIKVHPYGQTSPNLIALCSNNPALNDPRCIYPEAVRFTPQDVDAFPLGRMTIEVTPLNSSGTRGETRTDLSYGAVNFVLYSTGPVVTCPYNCPGDPYCREIQYVPGSPMQDLAYKVSGSPILRFDVTLDYTGSNGQTKRVVKRLAGTNDFTLTGAEILSAYSQIGNPKDMQINVDAEFVDALEGKSPKASMDGRNCITTIKDPEPGLADITNLRAIPGPSPSVSLTWQVNNYPAITAYRVYRSTYPITDYDKIAATLLTPFWVTPVTQPSHVDRSGSPGTAYYYAVTGILTDGSETPVVVAGPVTVAAPISSSVSGVVTFNGAPMGGVLVFASNSETNGYFSTRTGSDGRYSLILSGGNWAVSAQGANTFSASAPRDVAVTANGQVFSNIDFTLTLNQMHVYGTVRDGGGVAISGAVIVAANGPNTAYASSDGSGNYHLVIGPGTWNLEAKHDAFIPGNRVLSSPGAAGNVYGFNFSLERASSRISGTIRNTEGTLLGGASVTCLGTAGEKLVTADLFGAYAVTLGPGTWFVRAEKNGYVMSKKTVVIENNFTSKDNINFTLDTAASRITGIVQNQSGQGISGMTVRAIGENTYETVTASDGSYLLTVPPNTDSPSWVVNVVGKGLLCSPQNINVSIANNGDVSEGNNFTVTTESLLDVVIKGPQDGEPDVVRNGDVISVTTRGFPGQSNIRYLIFEGNAGTLVSTGILSGNASTPGVYSGSFILNIEGPNTIRGVASNSDKTVETVKGLTVDGPTPRIYNVSDAPDPFNPNRGPATITFELSRPAHATVDLYDRTGRFLSPLFSHDLLAGRIDFTWADSGTPDGIYVYRINATTATLNAPEQTGLITIDTSPPILTDLTPSRNSLLTTLPVTVSAKITDVGESGVDEHSIQVIFNGEPVAYYVFSKSTGMLTFTTGSVQANNTVSVSVMDKVGNLRTEIWTFTGDSTPPVAQAGVDIMINENGLAQLSASGSYDPQPGSGISGYWWDLDGNGSYETAGVTASKQYLDDGVHSIALKVTDDAGYAGYDTVQVAVRNVSPTVHAGPDQTVQYSDTINLSGTYTDPGTLDTHSFEWDFGEGTPKATSNNVSHRYLALAGVYTATFKVTDDDGGIGTDATAITVAKEDTRVTHNSVVYGQYSDQVILSATLTELDGEIGNLSGKTIRWTIGTQSVSGTTDASGIAQATIILAQKPGSYTIVAQFTGDDFYHPSSDTKNFTIEKEDSVLTYVGDTTEQYSDRATTQAVLLDADGNIIPGDTDVGIDGRNLTFLITANGISGDSDGGVTSVDGTAVADIPVTQIPGTYSVETMFAGDDYYLPAQRSDGFVIAKEDTVVTYTGDAAEQYTDLANMKAILSDPDDILVPSDINPGVDERIVSFLITPDDTSGDSSVATTGTDGQVHTTVQVTQLPLQDYTVETNFAGDDYYLPSHDSKPFDILKENLVMTMDDVLADYWGTASGENGDVVTSRMTIIDEDDSVILPLASEPLGLQLDYAPVVRGATPLVIEPEAATGGAATLMFRVPFESEGVNSTTLAFAGNEWFTPASTTAKLTIQDSHPPKVALTYPNRNNCGICRLISGMVKIVGSANDTYTDGELLPVYPPSPDKFDSYKLEYSTEWDAMTYVGPSSEITVDFTTFDILSSGLAPGDEIIFGTGAGENTIYDTLVYTVTSTSGNEITFSPDIQQPTIDTVGASPDVYRDTGTWTIINESSTPITDGVLAEWDTTVVPEGNYTLKLTAIEEERADSVTKPNISVMTANVTIVRPETDVLSKAVYGGQGNGIDEFNHPAYIAVDQTGNIFVTDRDNDRAQRITPDGVFSILLDTGLNKPEGIAVDSEGNVYLADGNNDRVVKITPGGTVTEFASGFNKTKGVAVDKNGFIYIADGNNDKVYKYAPSGTRVLEIPTVGGGDLNKPSALAVDTQGNIYVTDRNNDRVLKYDQNGNQLLEIGTSGQGQLNKPEGVAVNEKGYIYVSDTNTSRIIKYDPLGNFVLQLGVQGNSVGQFNKPGGLALFGCDEKLYTVDQNNSRVQVYGAEGLFGNQPVVISNLYNYPDPFDAVRGTTMFFNLSKDVPVELQIFNSSGELVRELTSVLVKTGLTFSANWDATNDSGQSVSGGEYTVKVIALDEGRQITETLIIYLVN